MLGVETRLENLQTFKPAYKPPQPCKPKAPAVFRSTKGASKHRRDLINSEISNLRDMLPFPESTRQRLSQLQIMSLSCVFIRKCNYFSRLFGNMSFNSETPFEFSESLNGFLITLTRDGKLLYISENVTQYLGHSMVDLMTQGDSIYDITDKRDHGVVQSHLAHGQFPAAPGSVSDEKAFFCRMNVSKSFKRQTGDHKVMHFRGHFVSPMVRDHVGNQPVFTALCSPLVTPDVRENVTENNTMIFRSVHGLDMKYIEMANNGEHHLGYSDECIKGKSWYELLHPEDLTEAKDKHMQLIKSSHEMGCMLTARLMSAEMQWVWVNMVLHIRQPFSGDNGEAAIVCTNHVISEQDAAGYKLQSQLYSSHIARSPEIFTSTSGGSPHHTISQVAGTEQYPQQHQQQVGYGSPLMEQQQQQRASTSSLSDSGSDTSSQQDHKQHIHAQIINRLKRKMSESSPPCKPVKMARQHDDHGSSTSGEQGNIMYTGSIGVSPLGSSAAAFMESATYPMDGGSLADPPVYVQLAAQPQISINLKDMYELQLPSPLTPSSVTSDVGSPVDLSCSGSLCVDVNDAAVVPASFLTPDSSPAASPKLISTPTQSLLNDIANLQDISFFAMEKSSHLKPQPVLEVKEEKSNSSVPLPELDLGCLEKYFAGNDLSLPNPDEMMMIMEQSIKKEEIEEDLVSMCESLLDLPTQPAAAGDYDCLLSVDSSLPSDTEEDSPLPSNHEQLLEELSQLSAAAANVTPSYGDDLESTLFNSTL